MSTTELVVDIQDIEFCLFEWLQVDQLQKFPKYQDFDAETLDLLLNEGLKFAKEVIAPTNMEADREGCSVVDGKAIVPKCLHNAYKQAYELGWASITAGSSSARRSPHLQAEACGSRSMMSTALPSNCAVTASDIASVVFPVPPFWAIIESVCMSIHQSVEVSVILNADLSTCRNIRTSMRRAGEKPTLRQCRELYIL